MHTLKSFNCLNSKTFATVHRQDIMMSFDVFNNPVHHVYGLGILDKGCCALVESFLFVLNYMYVGYYKWRHENV